MAKCYDWVAGKWPLKELKSKWGDSTSMAKRWEKSIANRENSKYDLKQYRTWYFEEKDASITIVSWAKRVGTNVEIRLDR